MSKLQVQSNHFEEFFSPELHKHGYQALYKMKTTEVYKGNLNVFDGCATFFRKDRFSCVKTYEVEFNQAVHSSIDGMIQQDQKKLALSRYIKDNVALIVILETNFPDHGVGYERKNKLFCVTNTHINFQPAHEDVKLLQLNHLLNGLKRIVTNSNIPMVVCGDFNSVPGSASHSLIATGKVHQMHPVLDPFGMLQPMSKLNHQFPLVSAYSTFSRMEGEDGGLELQRRKMDPRTNEPLFTTFSRDFFGTVDYIFYTADSLTVESLLELLDEHILRNDTALPSPKWSSDHIALLAEFRFK